VYTEIHGKLIPLVIKFSTVVISGMCSLGFNVVTTCCLGFLVAFSTLIVNPLLTCA